MLLCFRNFVTCPSLSFFSLFHFLPIFSSSFDRRRLHLEEVSFQACMSSSYHLFLPFSFFYRSNYLAFLHHFCYDADYLLLYLLFLLIFLLLLLLCLCSFCLRRHRFLLLLCIASVFLFLPASQFLLSLPFLLLCAS